MPWSSQASSKDSALDEEQDTQPSPFCIKKGAISSFKARISPDFHILGNFFHNFPPTFLHKRLQLSSIAQLLYFVRDLNRL